MSYDISYVSSTVASTASSTTTSSTDTATESLDSQKDMFLTILLTELQNQNPLDPTDTTEFTNQLATYSQLEQQIDTNSKLDDVLSAIHEGNSLSAFSYMGADVDTDTSVSVVQDNIARWTYGLPDDVSAVTLTVTDASGNVVQTIDLSDQETGTYSFDLDANDLDLSEGEALTLSIKATDADGNSVTPTISSSMTVTGIETDTDGSITLTAGNYSFSSSHVTSLSKTTA